MEDLAAIEDEKRTLPPGDPRLVKLAKRVEDVARRELSSTVRQRKLTEVGNEQVEAAAEPGSAEAAEARALGDHLREAYRRALAEREGR